jgi:phospholipid transport system transporter-binding protein
MTTRIDYVGNNLIHLLLLRDLSLLLTIILITPYFTRDYDPMARSPSKTYKSRSIPRLRKKSNIYYLSGTLDFETVPVLWGQNQDVLNNREPIIIFDLSEVMQSDSSGVALLIAWTRNFLHQSQTIRFIHLPSQMWAIIQLAGLENIIPIKV